MITKTPPFSERAEYINLSVHRDKGLAELRFARPSGAIISVSIPIDHLRELHDDIRLNYSEVAEIEETRHEKRW